MTETMTVGDGTRILLAFEASRGRNAFEKDRGLFKYVSEDPERRVSELAEHLAKDPETLAEFGSRAVLHAYVESVLDGTSQVV